MITVLLFAALKDAAGASQIELKLPSNASVADLKRELGAQHPKLEKWLPHVRVAVNQEYADDATLVPDGAEVALIPPVSGGADDENRPFVRVGSEELSLDEVVRAVSDEANGAAGAICTFLGLVRRTSTDLNGRAHDDILFLDYEAYAPMAARELERIAREARTKFGAICAITHRVGRLKVGEASVAVAVATPHRTEAFEACRWVMETLKRDVPIWKREEAESGLWWSEGSAG